MVNWIGVLATLVGVLGVGGTIALLVLAPAATGAVLSRLWSGLLGCTPCQIVLIVLVALFIGDQFGYSRAAKQCRETELRAELAAHQRDIETANAAAADADKRAADIADQANKTKLEDEAYIDDLKRHKTPDVCRLTHDDLRGLREFNDANRPGAQPAAGAGVHGQRRRPAPAGR